MRVLVATPWYAPEGGGLERYAHEVNRRLARRGHAVEVVAFTRGEPRSEAVDGVRVTRVAPSLVVSNTPLRARHPLTLARRARHADLVVGHGPVPFSLESASFAAAATRRPFVATYHAGRLVGGSPALDVLAALNRVTFQRLAFGTARAIVAVSPIVVERALARARSKSVVVPPGVDVRTFAPSGARRRGRVLFVGPLDSAYRWKGFDVLYRAFRVVAERDEEATLVAVGDGDLRETYAARSRADGLGERVELPGRLTETDLVTEYRRAAVVVLPSTSDAESFGMVLAEANACGAPVVATRLGSRHALVRDGENGLLVPPGDARALEDAITAVLADPEEARRMGSRGRAIVEAAHDWERVAEATERVYVAASQGHPVTHGDPGPLAKA